jgi:hypothetical protein
MRIPGGAMAPGLLQKRPSIGKRAQGMPGVRCTRSLVCKRLAHEHNSPQVHRFHTGIPCATVLRLISRSPRGTGLDSPRHGPFIATRLTPASGCQDHTSSPSAGSRVRLARGLVHRIPLPTSVTMAIRPSLWKRNEVTLHLIWVSGKAKYFSPDGLTRIRATSRRANQFFQVTEYT